MNLCDTFEKNVISSPSPSSGMLSSSASLEFWSITCWNVEARVGKKSDMAQPGNSLPVVGLAVALFTFCLGSLRLVDNQSLNNQTTVLPPKAIFLEIWGSKIGFLGVYKSTSFISQPNREPTFWQPEGMQNRLTYTSPLTNKKDYLMLVCQCTSPPCGDRRRLEEIVSHDSLF